MTELCEWTILYERARGFIGEISLVRFQASAVVVDEISSPRKLNWNCNRSIFLLIQMTISFFINKTFLYFDFERTRKRADGLFQAQLSPFGLASHSITNVLLIAGPLTRRGSAGLGTNHRLVYEPQHVWVLRQNFRSSRYVSVSTDICTITFRFIYIFFWSYK